MKPEGQNIGDRARILSGGAVNLNGVVMHVKNSGGHNPGLRFSQIKSRELRTKLTF